jgi:hypothetical protein
MTDTDNGHEPQSLDTDFIKEEVRRGGALVTMVIKMETQTWKGAQIIPAVEMRHSVLCNSEMIRLAARRLIESIDVEGGEAVAG